MAQLVILANITLLAVFLPNPVIMDVLLTTLAISVPPVNPNRQILNRQRLPIRGNTFIRIAAA